MAKSKQPSNLCLRIGIDDRDRHYGHIVGRVIDIEDLTRPGDYKTPLGFGDFQVSCQGDNMNEHTYAWGCYFHNAYRVDVADAERHFRLLSRIDRRLASLTAKYGDPPTFGAYVLRVADALDVGRFLVQRTTDSMVANDSRWTDCGAREAARRIDSYLVPYVTGMTLDNGEHQWRKNSIDPRDS